MIIVRSVRIGNTAREDPVMKCPHCGSEKIDIGVVWGKTTGIAGNVGLLYKSGIFIGTAQVYSDLCLSCGTILRTYIKESPDREWRHEPMTIGSK